MLAYLWWSCMPGMRYLSCFVDWLVWRTWRLVSVFRWVADQKSDWFLEKNKKITTFQNSLLGRFLMFLDMFRWLENIFGISGSWSPPPENLRSLASDITALLAFAWHLHTYVCSYLSKEPTVRWSKRSLKFVTLFEFCRSRLEKISSGGCKTRTSKKYVNFHLFCINITNCEKGKNYTDNVINLLKAISVNSLVS